MVALIYFLIYLSNIICIICINTQSDFFITKIIKRFISPNNFKKIQIKYNANIQIIENKNITNEFFINTTYISNDFSFDFYYDGKFFYLNDTNIDLLSTMSYKNWIILVESYSTYNKYVSNNRSLIKHLTKVFIIPKYSFPPLSKEARYCYEDLSIYLIEVEEDIFNQLKNKYCDKYDDNINYYATIKSKKYDIFPYLELSTINLFFSFILFVFIFIHRRLTTMFINNLKRFQINFLNDLFIQVALKLIIFNFFYAEFYVLNRKEGIIEESFLQKLFIYLFLIYNKSLTCKIILNTFYGIPLGFKYYKIYKFINYYLISLIILFYVLFQVFKSPNTIPIAFYIINVIIYMPKFSAIIFYSFKNMILLFKIKFKIRKNKRANNIYGRSLILKLLIVIIQFFAYLIYIFFFICLHQYLLFKNGNYFEIEKDILFHCLESGLIIIICIIYIPRKYPVGFEFNIIYIKERIKTNKIKISVENIYKSNIPKEQLTNDKDIKKFVKNNHKRYFSILNPKVFLDKDKNNNDANLSKNIKIGTICRF